MKRPVGIVKHTENMSPWMCALLCLGVLGIVVGINAALGFNSAPRILYIAPVWLATKFCGKWLGLAAVVAVLATTVAVDVSQAPHQTLNWYALQTAIRGGSYLVLMLLIGSVEGKFTEQKRDAFIDPLTNTYNRKALAEWRNRSFEPDNLVTLAMMDCDGFKSVNDQHGHAIGDELLKILAATLKNLTRRSDMVVRFGGDEFLVIFDGTTVEEAEEVMLRVEESFCSRVADAGYSIGLSYGCAEADYELDNIDKLIESADSQMYLHKRMKRSASLR